jgi:CheY-like chemotaxis protein
VAHGLDNILMVINGFSELLLDMMSKCDPHRRYVEEIGRAGQLAAELTQQLLPRAGQTPSPPPAGTSRESRALRDLAHDHSGHETILLVEDDELVLELARVVLEECGYTVLAASNGTEASLLAKQHEGQMHLLVSDLIMPGMNGGVLAQTLRPRNPAMRVLFMSGFVDTDLVPQALLAAGDAFLLKPFPRAVLARKVRAVLDAQPIRSQQAKPELNHKCNEPRRPIGKCLNPKREI